MRGPVSGAPRRLDEAGKLACQDSATRRGIARQRDSEGREARAGTAYYIKNLALAAKGFYLGGVI